MGLISSATVTICGNFAEVQTSKPENFDYMSNAKWLEVYPFSKREKIGKTICSCKQVKIFYHPYFGEDAYHLEACNLMKRLRDRSSLRNLWAWDHLPAIAFTEQAVEASVNPGIYVKMVSEAVKVKVRVANVNGHQVKLL
ncbi:hypothetical protein B5P43_18395 [Bacillus sp. SRB_336]|nr:hypothetical protein B5P43_18395 [Bacillus sp. SRB_336]